MFANHIPSEGLISKIVKEQDNSIAKDHSQLGKGS